MAALSDYAEKLLLDWSMTTGSATRPLWHGSMTASKSVADGDTLEFSIGNIDLTIA